MRCHGFLRPAVQVAAWTLLCGACSDTHVNGPGVTVRDSAGVRVVRNVTPEIPRERRWTVGTRAVIEIGSPASDSLDAPLDRITGALILDDRRIVLVNHSTPMVRWYSADGEFLFGSGRPGGGPGEFGGGELAYIHAIWPLAGDSIGTWEHSGRRMQVFDPAGRYARAVRLEQAPSGIGVLPTVVGRLGNGFATYVSLPRQPASVWNVFRQTFSYHWYRDDGTYARPIVEQLPGFVRLLAEAAEGARGVIRVETSLPFVPPVVAWSHGERLYYGSGEQYEIEVYDTTGMLSTVIQKAQEPRQLTAEMIEEYEERRLATANDGAPRASLKQYLSRLPYPRTLPPYERIRVDRDGWLWIQDYFLPADSVVTWSVFRPDGRWMTSVEMPAEFQVRDIGRDYVLVVERDAWDVEYLRLYPLERRR